MNTNTGRIDWAVLATVTDHATPALSEVPKPSVTLTRAMQVTV